MGRILMRAGKDPFRVASPEHLLDDAMLGGNVGNFVYAYAAYRHLALPGQEVVANHYKADPSMADRINEEFDALVLPLADAFRPNFMRTLRRHTELIKKLSIPVTVLSVGARSDINFSFELLQPLDDDVQAFVAAVLDKSPSIGVRGEFTADYLRRLGFRDVEVIGCPSVFMWGDRLRIDKGPDRLSHESRISVNVSPGVPTMTQLIDDSWEDYPQLICMTQDNASLERLLWGGDSLGEEPKISDQAWRGLCAQGRIRHGTDPFAWIEYLSGFDFSAGTRFHGNVAALLGGTPAVLLAHDSRTRELSRCHGIPHRVVRAGTPSPELAELHAEADFGPFHRGLSSGFRAYVSYVERAGLRHIFQPGEDRGAAFDSRYGQLPHQSPVRPTGQDVGQLVQRITYLREKTKAQARRQKTTSAQLSTLAATVRELQEQAALVPALQKRLAAAESAREEGDVKGRLRDVEATLQRLSAPGNFRRRLRRLRRGG